MAEPNRTMLALLAAAGCMGAGCSGTDDGNVAGGKLDGDMLDVARRWSYDGELGPERWHELDLEFATCGSGTQQSPIDIPSHISPGEFGSLSFDYAPAPATLVDNGHTIQVNLAEGASELDVDGDVYTLVQFHFHAHSEHSIDGVYLPLELHLVHRSESGGLAVVGVFLDIGAPNAALSPVFDGIQHAGVEPSPLGADVDPSALLPSRRQGWAYAGSLTTPPCTEGVRWHVMSSPLEMSAEQLDAFTARHQTNRRPVMENAGTVSSGSIRRSL